MGVASGRVMVIKVTCFLDMEAIKMAVMMKPRESFQECLEEWWRRMGTDIRFKGGKDFEGEKM